MHTSRFVSYVFQSFIPGKFSRFCILGVDVVGVPLLLIYGIPQSKTLAVLGWFGLRFALTGLCYLEHCRECQSEVRPQLKDTKSSNLVSQKLCASQAIEVSQVSPEEPIDSSQSTSGITRMTPGTQDVKSEVSAPTVELARIEFPRMESEFSEIRNVTENGGSRTIRTISLSSAGSETSVWSECQTPPRSAVELPVELEYAEESLETPRPHEAEWFGIRQDEVLRQGDTPKSIASQDTDHRGLPEPHENSPITSTTGSPKIPLRRKRSKYSARPLVPMKSSASLHLSQVTFDKPEAFTSRL